MRRTWRPGPTFRNNKLLHQHRITRHTDNARAGERVRHGGVHHLNREVVHLVSGRDGRQLFIKLLFGLVGHRGGGHWFRDTAGERRWRHRQFRDRRAGRGLGRHTFVAGLLLGRLVHRVGGNGLEALHPRRVLARRASTQTQLGETGVQTQADLQLVGLGLDLVGTRQGAREVDRSPVVVAAEVQLEFIETRGDEDDGGRTAQHLAHEEGIGAHDGREGVASGGRADGHRGYVRHVCGVNSMDRLLEAAEIEGMRAKRVGGSPQTRRRQEPVHDGR